ncbi:hypothetical protein CCACVL1_30515 [Corchorus capsularis]|uniref:Uncharacterized protein n=1 Tax=Corchorus capsularis TaxID=210143 RepID=A0A1R3FWS9_COCAP|nr:hypothetical protein CCACVL1_30515 [Corchorus capsularis]
MIEGRNLHIVLKSGMFKSVFFRSFSYVTQEPVEKVEFQQELGEKTQEVAHWKKLSEDVLKKIEWQALHIVLHNEEQLIECNKEKKLLMANFGKLKENYDELRLVLRQKTKEVEEGRKLQEQLLAQIDFKSSEILKNNQQLAEHGKQKELLLAQVKGLEEKVNSLQITTSDIRAQVEWIGGWMVAQTCDIVREVCCRGNCQASQLEDCDLQVVFSNQIWMKIKIRFRIKVEDDAVNMKTHKRRLPENCETFIVGGDMHVLED